MNVLVRVLEAAKHSSDVVLAFVVAAIVGAMIVPLPGWLLDVGLALNLATAAALLVAALYAQDALKVASFPTLLLVSTLLRLALNVSSTRLALSEGHAGDVIQAFGEFVVRGNYVVGMVIFAILALVQFLVVAKGAERVAEVSARFTLDAMPGKQMSIDADLRSGAIDQGQARHRRRQLERESQLFGAMDGAMKFVKGDVVAGLVIVLVNLVGGTAIGVFQIGMSLADAASSYALLAVGDGLASQIPSLCTAVAAGLVVTRVSSESEGASLGSEIGAQFFGHWKALLVVAGLCLALGSLPGMPHVTFIVLAGLAAGVGYVLKGRVVPIQVSDNRGTGVAPPTEGEKRCAPVLLSRLTLDLSADLGALAAGEDGGSLSVELDRVRAGLFAELGVPVQPIRVRAGGRYLSDGSYALLMDEVPCGKGRLSAQGLYAVAPQAELAFLEVRTEGATEPATGKAISRIPADARARAEAANFSVRTAEQLLGEHVRVLLRARAAHLLGVQEVQGLLEAFEPQSPALVREVLQKMTLPLLTDVLKRLVEEQVSVRNLRVILEALASPLADGGAVVLVERCRQALHRYLSHKYAPSGPLYAYLVDPEIEEALRASKVNAGVDPEKVAAIIEGARRVASLGSAVVLTAPDVRRVLRKLTEGALPELAVLTYGELDADLPIRPLGRLLLPRASA